MASSEHESSVKPDSGVSVIIRTSLRLGVAGFKVVMKGKTFLDVFVL